MVSMEKVAKHISSLIYDELSNVFQQVATENKLDYNMLMQRYANKYLVSSSKQKRKKKEQHDEEIATEEYEYNGTTYLIDQNNIIYTYDLNHPRIVGERLIDGTVKLKI
jgi:hypothetical protein